MPKACLITPWARPLTLKVDTTKNWTALVTLIHAQKVAPGQGWQIRTFGEHALKKVPLVAIYTQSQCLNEENYVEYLKKLQSWASP